MESPSFKKIVLLKTTAIPQNLFEIRPFRSNCFELLESFSVLTYYLLLTPYRLVVTRGVLTIQTSSIQKVLCGLFQFLCVLQLTTKVRKVFSDPIKLLDDPTRLYTIAQTASDVIGELLFIKACWAKGPHGLTHLYRCGFDISKSNFKDPIVKDWARAKSIGFWTLCLSLVFIDCIHPHISAVILDTLDEGKGWHRSKEILKRSIPEVLDVLGISEGPLYFICSAGLVIINIHAELIYRSALILLPIIACFISFRLSKDLQKALKEENLSFGHVIQYYNSIKSVLSTMNEVVGGLLVVNIVCALTFFSFCLTRVLDNDSNNLWMRIQITIFFGMFSTAMVLAAEANLKLNVFSEYIFENRMRVGFADNPDFGHILGETRHSNIGLKAYAFTITYSSIASIFSTVLTYFVILLQFQISKPIN